MLNTSQSLARLRESELLLHGVKNNLINLDVKLLNEGVNVFELPDVGVLGRLVLQDGEFHEWLGDAVGNDALWRRNGGQDDREQAVGQLVVDLE